MAGLLHSTCTLYQTPYASGGAHAGARLRGIAIGGGGGVVDNDFLQNDVAPSKMVAVKKPLLGPTHIKTTLAARCY